MWKINPARVLADLRALRRIGGQEGGPHAGGVIRPALSAQDLEARTWLAAQFRAVGLDPQLDRVANMVGRAPHPGRVMLVGSHTDTQPVGGWLDGALGVVAALECVRAGLEAEGSLPPVEPVSWQDEEGRFGSCLGSALFAGRLDTRDLAGLVDGDGVRLEDAIFQRGLHDEAVLRHDPARHAGYLELHIEQGPRLEEAGMQIGVVSGITAIRARRFVLHGEANHAGTTTMERRKDAARSLFTLAERIHTGFPALASAETVWTISRVSLQPNAPSIVPGRAECTLQMRSPEEAILDRMEQYAGQLAVDLAHERDIRIENLEDRRPIAPIVMDPDLVEVCRESAQMHAPGSWRELFSLAGHDPMVLAHHMKCAMLFIPSIGGISHDPAEDSLEEDIAAGVQVLADAARLACARLC